MGTAAVVDLLTRLGGVASRRQLVLGTSRADVDQALAGGEVVAVARGRYALADVDEAVGVAHALGGVLSWRSVALHHGWAVARLPSRPEVTVPRGRRLPTDVRAALHFAQLGPDELAGHATSRERTLLDCLRNLPFDEALSVADSALRARVAPTALAALARDARGAGAGRVNVVAAAADGGAAKPFESVLRALCHDVDGLPCEPRSRSTTRTSSDVQTSSTTGCGSWRRPTRSPGTAVRRRWRATPGATTS